MPTPGWRRWLAGILLALGGLTALGDLAAQGQSVAVDLLMEAKAEAAKDPALGVKLRGK